MTPPAPYTSTHKIRIVTAASLFDGHDAAINIMRRILQSSGAEVIHLGHNRSVAEVVDAAIQEDAQAIAMTSYQGGHVEYLKYMFDLLNERGAGHIRIFGGGGGTILPTEIDELHAYGIARLYSPDDGRALGLQGMINDLLAKADYSTVPDTWAPDTAGIAARNPVALAQAITALELGGAPADRVLALLNGYTPDPAKAPVLGITGTGGAGKSSLTDELVRRFLLDFEGKTMAILSIDPTRKRSGGALLGDRIRMNAIHNSRIYMRSMATREANVSISRHVSHAVQLLQQAGFDLVVVETAGIGQSDTQITELANVALYVMTPEFGAATQLEKIDMLDYADVIAINKSDKKGAQDALRDVRKQYQRNRNLWDRPTETMPVYASMASQFNDPGTNRLYQAVMETLATRTGAPLASTMPQETKDSEKIYIIPPDRTRYLAEIAEEIDRQDKWAEAQARTASQLYQLSGSIQLLEAPARS